MLACRPALLAALLAGALASGPAALFAQQPPAAAPTEQPPSGAAPPAQQPPPATTPGAQQPPPATAPGAQQPPSSAAPASPAPPAPSSTSATAPASAPRPAPAPAGGAASASKPATSSGRGAVVVAVDDAAARAARALARVVYADPALRPAIDEPTAKALTEEAAHVDPGPGSAGSAGSTGSAGSAGSTDRATEIAQVRKAAAEATTESAARRLLASLGADTGAALVVVVRLEGSRPSARIIHVATASYAPVELGATLNQAEPSAKQISWPGATETLRSLLPPPPKTPVRGVSLVVSRPASAPPPQPDKGGGTTFWRSPWFWGALGAAAAIGGAAFAISRATEDSGSTLHVVGRVAP